MRLLLNIDQVGCDHIFVPFKSSVGNIGNGKKVVPDLVWFPQDRIHPILPLELMCSFVNPHDMSGDCGI